MREAGEALDFSSTEVVTFDCYGTLIDWETGIYNALQPIVEAHGTPLEKDVLLELYAGIEAEIERQIPFRSYRTVLNEVVEVIGARLGWTPSSAECEALSASLPGWPPFEDTVTALHDLGEICRLVVISNVDDDLFAGTSGNLGVAFDHVITAQQVGAYKPDISVFERALQIINVEKESIVHVAQSLFHDIAPARDLGLRTVWVNRRKGQEGWGATPPANVHPHMEVPDLKSFMSQMVQT